MSDRSHQPFDRYRSRQPTYGLLGSLAVAAAVPAVVWLPSNPLPTALLAVVAAVAVAVRSL
jgi:hypothetical protein